MTEGQGLPVLLVIDCQEGFITSESEGILGTVRALIEEWRAWGCPVILTRFVNRVGSPYERLINWTACQGPPDTLIAPELKHFEDEGVPVVDKDVYTFFTREWADRALSQGWDDVVILGIDTDGCVLKTALDAFELNLTPWIVTDATASHSGEKAYDAALYIAGRTIGRGQLISADECARFAPS